MHQDGSVYMSGTTANSTSGTDFAVVHLDSDGRELWVFQVWEFELCSLLHIE